MLFFWMFSLAGLLILLLARLFLSLSSEIEYLVLSFVLLLSTPLVIPMASYLRKEKLSFRPILTRFGITGVSMVILMGLLLVFGLGWNSGNVWFLLIILFAVWFAVDIRLFIVSALLGAFVVIVSVIVGVPSTVEDASSFVYLALIVGVFPTLTAPFLDHIASRTHHIWKPKEVFIQEYKTALKDYSWMIAFGLQLLFVALLIGRIYGWYIDLEVGIYISFGVWAFFLVYLLMRHRDYGFDDFFWEDIRWFQNKKLMRSSYVTLALFAILTTTMAVLALASGLPFIQEAILLGVVSVLVWGITGLLFLVFYYVKKRT